MRVQRWSFLQSYRSNLPQQVLHKRSRRLCLLFPGSTHKGFATSSSRAFQEVKNEHITTLGSESASTELLKRAKAFGIQSTEQLQLESKEPPGNNPYSRLVDRPEWRDNLDLWCLFLDFRRFKFGDRGVQLTFEDLRKQCSKTFPFVGPQADYLWDAFVASGIRDLPFLERVCNWEIRKGAQRPDLLVDVCGRLLHSNNASQAPRFAALIHHSHKVTQADLVGLCRNAGDSKSEGAFEHFCNMSFLFEGLKVYDQIINTLTRNNEMFKAWAMHRFLISIGDLPARFDTLVPFVQDLASTGSSLKSFLDSLKYAGVSFEAQVRRLYDLERTRMVGMSATNLNITASKTLGVQPKGLSDEFAARAFATTSLSFDFVLNALRLLGLVAVGPLAVRQIVLGADGTDEVNRRFNKLQEVGVDTGSSAYVRLVKRLASMGQREVLASVLQSDQHPDVFEDRSMQKKLMSHYLHIQDHASVNQTAAVLDLQHSINPRRRLPLHVILDSALEVRDWSTVSSILLRLFRGKGKIDSRITKSIRERLFPKRRPNRELHTQKDLDGILFFISVAQTLLNSGLHLEPAIWREPIIRLGMMGHWNEAERTVLWVASHYYNKPDFGSKPLDVVFTPTTQQAMITWGFIHPSTGEDQISGPSLKASYNTRAEDLWLRGIRLLRQLADQYDVSISFHTVQRAVMLRLRALFSVGGFSKLVSNRRLREHNSQSLEYYLSTFYRVWRQPLSQSEASKTIEAILRTVPTRASDTDHFQSTRRWEGNQRRGRVAAAGGLDPQPAATRCSTILMGQEMEISETEVVTYQDLYNPSWEEYKEAEK